MRWEFSTRLFIPARLVLAPPLKSSALTSYDRKLQYPSVKVADRDQTSSEGVKFPEQTGREKLGNNLGTVTAEYPDVPAPLLLH